MLKCCSPITCNLYVNDVKSCKISYFQALSGSHLGHKSVSLLIFLKWMCFYTGSCNKRESFSRVIFSTPHNENHSAICIYLMINEHYLTYVAPSGYFTINASVCLCLKETPPIHNIFTQKLQASNSQNLKFHNFYKNHNIQTVTS